METLRMIFETIATDSLTRACFVVSITFLLLYYFLCYKKLLVLEKELKKINSELEIYDQQKFLENFDVIDRELLENKLIASIWREYSKSLIRLKEANISQTLFSTFEASSYFNDSKLLAGINISFWQNLGGIFTGIGILGTFLGLTVGLDQLGHDIKSISSNIANMLPGIKLAFVTSIVGVSLAVLFSVLHYNRIQKTRNAIANLAATFERLIPCEPAEKWLAKSYAQDIEQASQLKGFNEQLAANIGEAIAERFENSNLAEKLNSIDGNLAAMQSFVSERLAVAIGTSVAQSLLPTLAKMEDALEKISEGGGNAISETFDKSAGEELNKLNQTIADLNAYLAKTMEQFVAASATVRSEIGEATTAMTDQAATQREVFDSTIRSLKEQIDEQTKVIVAAAEKLQVLNDSSNEVMDKAIKAADGFERAALPISEMTQGLNVQASKLIDACADYNQCVQQGIEELRAAAKDNLASMEDVKKGMEITQEAWQAYSEHFEGVNGELTQIIENLSAAMKENSENLFNSYKESLKAYDEKLKEAIALLACQVEDLNSVVSSLGKR